MTPEDQMNNRDEFLVETDWLARHLDDPAVRVVDIRGSVPPVPTRDGAEPGGSGLGYAGAREDYE